MKKPVSQQAPSLRPVHPLRWPVWLIVLAPAWALAAPSTASRPDLLDAHKVLEAIAADPAQKDATPENSDASKLLHDIQEFRVSSGSKPPQEAAAEWERLLDRSSAVNPAESVEVSSFDLGTRKPVGILSVVAALPPPDAWKALNVAATKRSAAHADYRSLGAVLLTDVLLGNRDGARSALTSVDGAISALPPDERQMVQQDVTQIRHGFLRLYGSPAELTEAFVTSLRDASKRASLSRGSSSVEVPDLVTLVGEDKASGILSQALTLPVSLRVESGDATRALARRLAVKNLDALQAPQWALVDSIDSADLYEGLARKFPAGNPSDTPSDPGYPSFGNDPKDRADAYYLLYLITNHRVADAEKLLASRQSSEALQLPKQAIRALQAAHQNQALYEFLEGALSRNPELQAWDVYIEQAAYTGNSRSALTTIDSALKRSHLPQYLRTELEQHRADALLALDRTKEGTNALLAIISKPPAAGDPALIERTTAALRVAALGRILGEENLQDRGLEFTEAVLKLPPQNGSTRQVDRSDTLRSLFAELRKEGKPHDAQRLAIAELRRRDADDGPRAAAMEIMGVPGLRPTRRAALVELVSLYSGADMPADARLLMDNAIGWGARDVRDLLKDLDSRGVPFGASAGKVLAATGDSDAAIRTLTATIAEFPGQDAAYEVEAAVDPNAAAVFEAQFNTDQFEERPLIWLATLQFRAKKLEAAEKTVRAAIAIDPSDGDEGVNDRMRAYSVLAEILEARGDAKGAAEMREVVTSIRISERTDEYYAVGLYERAFAGYRTALEHFSDAYCIQSRLAVQLSKQGRHAEAADHYRRAYELMPSSFGRVESHCFGCESVFEGAPQQTIAEQVFATLAKKNPGNAQIHYLQGYLFQEEGRYAEALPAFRTAVQIDGSYLNAWRQLNKLSEHIYLPSADRDVITTKLLELDPQQRHVQYDISSAGDFAALWYTVEKQARAQSGRQPHGEPLYSLKESARFYDRKQAALPAELRRRIEEYKAVTDGVMRANTEASPPLTLGRHALLMNIGGLMGGEPVGEFSTD